MVKCKECKSKAHYNTANSPPMYCGQHKRIGMINTFHNRCLMCDKMASYNSRGEAKRLYCSKHKLENMILIGHRTCYNEKCGKEPIFNLANEASGIFCAEHKQENMVNVKDKKCAQPKCSKQPHFNLPSEKSGLYCGEHKQERMVNVRGRKCLEDNCNKHPLFNSSNKKNGLYCAEHKKENMVDVKSKKCLEENCTKRPGFNLHTETKGLYCIDHKKPNMIHVLNKRCLEESCVIRPSYNFEGITTPIYCNKHKKTEMVNVKDRNHKCKNNCGSIPNKTNKCKGYCVRCFIHLFPNEKVSTNYKVKEEHVCEFIKEHFKNENCIFDKEIDGGCSKRRPDVYIDKHTHVIVIECDENQHKNKKYTSCDNKRTMEIFQDFGNRPIVFVRFNPDAYINNDGNKILSSFKYHKKLDVPTIRCKKEWSIRLDKLKDVINYWIDNLPKREITNEYLFFDQ